MSVLARIFISLHNCPYISTDTEELELFCITVDIYPLSYVLVLENIMSITYLGISSSTIHH